MIGITVSSLITQLVSVALLLFLLYRFAYRPISNAMQERSAKIADSLDAAEKARAEVKQAGDDAAKELARAQEESRRIVADARDAAKKLTEQEHATAKKQVEDMLSKADAEIARRTATAVEQARSELGQVVMIATELTIRQKLDKKGDAELIEKIVGDALAESKKG